MLVKISLICGFLLLTSISVLFISQLANPHILRKHFYSFSQGWSGKSFSSNFEDSFAAGNDFEIFDAWSEESIIFLNNFSAIVEKCSIESFGLYQPQRVVALSEEVITGWNFTESTNQTLLIGLPNDLFLFLLNVSEGNVETDALIITNQSTIPLGEWLFSYQIYGTNNTFNFQLNITSYLLEDLFRRDFPTFYDFLSNRNLQEANHLILMPLEKFAEIFQPVKEQFSGRWSIYAFVKFTIFQRDIMYWSIDSPGKVHSFLKLLISELKAIERTFTLVQEPSSLMESFFVSENPLIYLIYSFIRIIQIFVWLLSIFLIALTIAKLQKSNIYKELRTILSGISWRKRILWLFMESLLISLGASLIVILLLFPFIRLQVVFGGTRFVFTNNIFIGASICLVVLFTLILSTFIDFDFYLRRVLVKGLYSEEYRPLGKMRRSLKGGIGFILLVLFTWLLNYRDYFATLIELGIIIGVGIISFLFYYFMRFLVNGIIQLKVKNKLKTNKPASKAFILFKFRQKALTQKMFIYLFALTFISSMLFYSTFTADSYTSSYIYIQGAEITITTKELPNIDSLNPFLENYSAIEDFTSVLKSYHMTAYDNHTLIKTDLENQTAYLFGISPEDYFNFYSNWNKKHWLAEGELTSTNTSMLYVSNRFKSLEFLIGDIIEFIDGSKYQIGGFIEDWPVLCDKYDSRNELIIIMPASALQTSLILLGENNFSVNYYLHIQPKKINATISYLEPHLKGLGESFVKLTALDTLVFTGIRIVFLIPIIILFEIGLFFFGAFFLFQQLEELVNDPAAKTLGLVAMQSNYRLPFRKTLFIEDAILLASLGMIFLINFFVAFLILPAISGLSLGLVGISTSSLLYSIILFLLFAALLAVQNGLEYWRYYQIDLSEIYRYPE
ncbi:MAG: hypothetical protein ACTSYG_00310 [Candidatus Heimdallarchaeota archaeon]